MIEDLIAPFLADFAATSCTVGGVAVRAIFDSDYSLGGAGLSGMSSSQPTLTLATASIAADPVGLAVLVNGASYLVAAHEPDGTGLSLLRLERA